MRISDWSSDVCSSDLGLLHRVKTRDEANDRRILVHAESVAELRPRAGTGLELVAIEAVGDDDGRACRKPEGLILTGSDVRVVDDRRLDARQLCAEPQDRPGPGLFVRNVAQYRKRGV